MWRLESCEITGFISFPRKTQKQQWGPQIQSFFFCISLISRVSVSFRCKATASRESLLDLVSKPATASNRLFQTTIFLAKCWDFLFLYFIPLSINESILSRTLVPTASNKLSEKMKVAPPSILFTSVTTTRVRQFFSAFEEYYLTA